MVDMRHLKCRERFARAGSTPAPGTNRNFGLYVRIFNLFL